MISRFRLDMVRDRLNEIWDELDASDAQAGAWTVKTAVSDAINAIEKMIVASETDTARDSQDPKET